MQGADVYILADNDEAGKRVAETIRNDIKTVAKSSIIIVPMPDAPKADITHPEKILCGMTVNGGLMILRD